MKKNISINISGIIFHIEEDGYDKLKVYLDGISSYFSTFSDSKEIISDIEGRIAEIFLSKLNEEKQIITLDDVDHLVSTMGSIEDFQAIEDPDETEEQKQRQGQGAGQNKETHTHYTPPKGPRDLKRDESRKILGGVCAGIANYFNIDPLWVRLLSLILFLGSYGVLFIVYLVLWAVLPGSNQLEETHKTRKMFRNTEDKVIAGVASGVSTYFGLDVWVVRVLFFALTIVGGSGLIAYLVLWIILPEAKTITDKVQMKGEPITLSNIESNVKQSLNIQHEEEEHILVKILLFPFRLIAKIINGIGTVLGPILLLFVDVLRIMVGVAIMLAGFAGTFAIVVSTGILTGVLSGGFLVSWQHDHWNRVSEPILMLFESIPQIHYLMAFIFAIIPMLFAILLGISIISKRIVFNAVVGWSMFGLMIISGIFLAVNIPGIVYSYHEQANYEEDRSFNIDYSTFVLKADRKKGFENYYVTDLDFKGHEGTSIDMKLDFSSHGYSNEDAEEHAKMVRFDIIQEDSTLIFDNNISLKEDGKFKFQELDITVYLPYNRPFIMDRSIRNLVSYRAIDRYGYSRSQVNDENRWIFTEEGLECLTCEKVDDGWDDYRSNETSRLIDVADFNSIVLNSTVSVEIRKDSKYRVEIRGQESYIDNISFHSENGELEIKDIEELTTARNYSRSRDAVRVFIYTPNLQSIELRQASKANIKGLSGNDFSVRMDGAASAEMDVDYDVVDLSLSGNSSLELSGRGEQLSADVNGNSNLNGYNYRVKNSIIKVYGASSAKVYASETIEINRDIVSSVQYRGGGREIDSNQ